MLCPYEMTEAEVCLMSYWDEKVIASSEYLKGDDNSFSACTIPGQLEKMMKSM
jgi:hypothetical protein